MKNEKEFVDEVVEAIGELAPKRSENPVTSFQFKMGEEIANSVRYWGQDRVKNGNRTAMCVCPSCGELWRTRVSNVVKGMTKSCGCGK